MAFAQLAVIYDTESDTHVKASDGHIPGGAPAGTSGPVNEGLAELLVAMRSDSETIREAAWAACYERYRDIVWTRVFYVLRTISWLREPREAAEDVTSDVFVGLVEAAKQYREEGKPEQWLARVAVRAALRARERLTGEWNRQKGTSAARRHVSFDDEENTVVTRLDSVDREELMELERRIAALRGSANPRDHRWAEFIDLYRDGYGYGEIGKRLNLTEATARNWLVAIRKHLATPIGPGNG